VIDLNAWTRDLYVRLGREGSRDLFCHFAPGEHAHWPGGLVDNTHFSRHGASLVAGEVARQLRRLGYGPAGEAEPAGTWGMSTTAGRA